MNSKAKRKEISIDETAFKLDQFPDLDQLFHEFSLPSFKKLSARIRFRRVNETLLDLLQKAPMLSFLLGAVIEFISRVNREKVLAESYHLTLFEFWLNNFSKLSFEENQQIRAKISGKWIPRDEYQIFFPIGMQKVYSGSHIVSAHLSPDVDTTIASFWGWLDAFSAKIGTGLHRWQLPGGAPVSPVMKFFNDIFGKNAVSLIARSSHTITLSAMDLLTQKNIMRENGTTPITRLDHGANQKAILYFDEHEQYRGEWRVSDIESVRQVVILLKASLHWLESYIKEQLISIFSHKIVKKNDITSFLQSINHLPIAEFEPYNQFSKREKEQLFSLFKLILNLPHNEKTTWKQIYSSLFELYSINSFENIQSAVDKFLNSNLFDQTGHLIENRPHLFTYLQGILSNLNTIMRNMRDGLDRLDFSLAIKQHVLQIPSSEVNLLSDIETIQNRIKNHHYLIVTIPEDKTFRYPVGVIWREDLKRLPLGTVSFRDFSNFEEAHLASYLSVISVIDHHKMNLNTKTPSLLILGDAQACNVLIAEQVFSLNDRYSLGGMTHNKINQQIKSQQKLKTSEKNTRILSRLFCKKQASQRKEGFSIHPKRELLEYLFFLYAILDDTDLLTKVTKRDIECVSTLLNRITSLIHHNELEIITINDIPHDDNFIQNATNCILTNPTMTELYQKIFQYRMEEILKLIQQSSKGLHTTLFEDTKIINQCCRVGQIKLFSEHIPLFKKFSAKLHTMWLNLSAEIFQQNPTIDFHLMMISTIPTSNDMLKGKPECYAHKDELWLWFAPTERGQAHMAGFLNAFKLSPEISNNQLEITFFGSKQENFSKIVTEHFLSIKKIFTKSDQTPTFAILNYNACSLNSRKSMIAPYLPQFIP